MYRIEVTPGEETVFRTMEELAVAIRNGLVTPRARIYHNASQKWLPIGLHPHYKKAMELPAASSAHPKTPDPVPAKPLSKARVEPHTAEHPVRAEAGARAEGPCASHVAGGRDAAGGAPRSSRPRDSRTSPLGQAACPRGAQRALARARTRSSDRAAKCSRSRPRP